MMHAQGGSRLLKGGTARSTVTIVDVELAGICTLIVCEAHRHALHADTRRFGACPQEI